MHTTRRAPSPFVPFMLTGLLGLSALLLAPRATAQSDDLTMMYGQSRVHILQGDIMSNASKRRAELARGVNAPGPKEPWPGTVNTRNIGQHVFTVRELRAMGSADVDRKRELIAHREITVQGVVRHMSNTDRQFMLVIPGQEYYKVSVRLDRRGPKPKLPKEGETVRLRGKVGKVYSRHGVDINAPQYLTASTIARR